MKFSPSVSSSRRKSRKVGVKAVKECCKQTSAMQGCADQAVVLQTCYIRRTHGK